MNIANAPPPAREQLTPRLGKSIQQVIVEVADKHGFSYLEMLSSRRRSPLAWARQEAYWRCTKETIYSLPVIGRHFGGRDHTTVLKGAQVYAKRRASGAPDIHPVQARLLAEAEDRRRETAVPAVCPEVARPMDVNNAAP